MKNIFLLYYFNFFYFAIKGMNKKKFKLKIRCDTFKIKRKNND